MSSSHNNVTTFDTFFKTINNEQISRYLSTLISPCKKIIREYDKNPSSYDENKTKIYNDTKHFMVFIDDIFKKYENGQVPSVTKSRLKNILVYYPHYLRGEFIDQFIPVGFETYRSSEKHFLYDIYDRHLQLNSFIQLIKDIDSHLVLDTNTIPYLLYDSESNKENMSLCITIKSMETYCSRFLITCGLFSMTDSTFLTEEMTFCNGDIDTPATIRNFRHLFTNLSINDIFTKDISMVFRLYLVERSKDSHGLCYKTKQGAAVSFVPLKQYLQSILIGSCKVDILFFTMNDPNFINIFFYNTDGFLRDNVENLKPFILNPEAPDEDHTNFFSLFLDFESYSNDSLVYTGNHSEYLPNLYSSLDYDTHSELIFQFNGFQFFQVPTEQQYVYFVLEIVETKTGEKQCIIVDGKEYIYQYKTSLMLIPTEHINFSVTVKLSIPIVAFCHARLGIFDVKTSKELFFTYIPLLDESQLPLQSTQYTLKLYSSKNTNEGYVNPSDIYEYSNNTLSLTTVLCFPKISSSYVLGVLINQYISNEDKVKTLQECTIVPEVTEIEQCLDEVFDCLLKPFQEQKYLNQPTSHWSQWFCSYFCQYIHMLVLDGKENIVESYMKRYLYPNNNLATTLLSYINNQLELMINIMNSKRDEDFNHLEGFEKPNEDISNTTAIFDIDNLENSKEVSDLPSTLDMSLFKNIFKETGKSKKIEVNWEGREEKRAIIEERNDNGNQEKELYMMSFVTDLKERFNYLNKDEKQICWNVFHLYTALQYILLLISRCSTSFTSNDKDAVNNRKYITAASSNSSDSISVLAYTTFKNTILFIHTNALSFSFIQSQAISVFVDCLLCCKRIFTSDQFFELFQNMMYELSQQKQSQGREAVPLNYARALYQYDIVNHWEDTSPESDQLSEHFTNILIFNISNCDAFTRYISLHVFIKLLKREQIIRESKGLSTFTKLLAQLYGVLIDFFTSTMDCTIDPLHSLSESYGLHDIQSTYLHKRLLNLFPSPLLLPITLCGYIDYLKLVKDSTYLDRFEVHEINTIVLIMQKMSYSIQPIYPSNWIYMTYYTEIKIRPFIQHFLAMIHEVKPVPHLFSNPEADDPIYIEFWTNLIILTLSLFYNYMVYYSELYKTTLKDPMVHFVESLWKYLSAIYPLFSYNVLPYILRLVGIQNNPTSIKILCTYMNALAIYHKTDTKNINYLNVLNQDFYNFIDKWMDTVKDTIPLLYNVPFDEFFSDYLLKQYESYYPSSTSIKVFLTEMSNFVKSISTVNLCIKHTENYKTDEFEITQEILNLLHILKQNQALKLLIYNSFQLAYFHMKLKNYAEASQTLVYAADQLQWSTEHIDVIYEGDSKHVSTKNKLLILSKNIISLFTYLFPSYIAEPYIYNVIESYKKGEPLPSELLMLKSTLKDKGKNYFGIHYKPDEEGCWKELLLRAASIIAYKGKNYDITLNIYSKLEDGYKKVLNYEILSQILSDKALIYHHIDNNQCTYPSYFILERYGVFPNDNLPNPCVIKGNNDENIKDFKTRISKYLVNGTYSDEIPANSTIQKDPTIWYYTIQKLRVNPSKVTDILNRRVFMSSLNQRIHNFSARYPYHIPSEKLSCTLSTWYLEYEIDSEIEFPSITRLSALSHTDKTLNPIQIAIDEVDDAILNMKMHLYSLDTNRKTNNENLVESIIQIIEPKNLNGIYKYISFFTGEWKSKYPEFATSLENSSSQYTSIIVFRQKVIQLYDVTRETLLYHRILPNECQQLQQTLIDKLNKTYLEIIIPLKKLLNKPHLDE